VVVAVWLNGEILAVTQSYQDTLTWPGGGIEPREEARDSAVRELREELGLVVGPQELIYVDTVTVDWRFRNDCVRLFELKLNARPHLHLDNREIIAARFMAPAAMLLADPPPFVAPYLRRHIEGDSINPG
jgi:8-oxo-dGTP pyrophosphatase MutT (NUDIX family)